MESYEVSINGFRLDSRLDYSVKRGEVSLAIEARQSDAVEVQILRDGILVERNVYEALPTRARTPLRWRTRTTFRFDNN